MSGNETVTSERVYWRGKYSRDVYNYVPSDPDFVAAVERVHVLTDEELAARDAEVLRSAAGQLPAWTEGPNREGTATWSDATRDAYSLAIEEASEALRSEANQIEAGGRGE